MRLFSAVIPCLMLVFPSAARSQAPVPAQADVVFVDPVNLIPLIPRPSAPPSLGLVDPRPASPTPKETPHAPKTQFFVLSGLVYAAATTDMVSTHDRMLSEQQCPVCYLKPFTERDPLARPFVRMPTPAYYSSAYLFFTGVNLLAWKMSRSPRWHPYWRVPQLLSLAGSSWGISTFH
jgi:hypothetical protein